MKAFIITHTDLKRNYIVFAENLHEAGVKCTTIIREELKVTSPLTKVTNEEVSPLIQVVPALTTMIDKYRLMPIHDKIRGVIL